MGIIVNIIDKLLTEQTAMQTRIIDIIDIIDKKMDIKKKNKKLTYGIDNLPTCISISIFMSIMSIICLLSSFLFVNNLSIDRQYVNNSIKGVN